MAKVRIGFVGTGTMGQCAHLWNFTAIDECRVVALAELRPQLGREVAERYGVPNVYTDADDMLARESLDGLVCTQQFWFLGQLLPPLFKAGLPILTEKPIAHSAQVGEQLTEQARRQNVRLYLGYHKRSDPATVCAKQQIADWQASGQVGRLKYVRITMPPGDFIAGGFSHLIQSDETVPELSRDPLPPDMDEPTFKRYGGLVNYYVHQVNLMRHLLGEDYQVTFADPGGALMALRSASGVSGAIEIGPYRTSVAWQERALIAFERGWIRLELPPPMAVNRSGRVIIYNDSLDGKPHTIIPELPNVHAMRQQAVNFVNEIGGRPTSLCQADEAVQDLVVLRDYLRQWIANEESYGDASLRQ